MPPLQPPAIPSFEALFRFRVVSEVMSEMLRGMTRAQAVTAMCTRPHVQLSSGEARGVKRRTLYRWLAAFRQGGIAALEPAPRTRTATSVVLPKQFVAFIVAEKKLDPLASAPELIERARQRGKLGSLECVDRVTVWRAVARMGLPTRRRPTKHEGDTRRFAYPNRMQMVLCDGKHFRAGVNRLRRVALYFIDDCTRRALHVVVGSSESTQLFLRGLYEMVQRHGMMDALYLDRGPGFRSDDTFRVVAQLQRTLILGAVAYPQGHGKIERFNQTSISGVVRSLDRAVDVDPSFGSLELRLRHYLEHYNNRPHESLGQFTPRARWDADTRELSFPADEAALRACFVVTEERTVSNDHVIQSDGVDYEAPRGLAREKVWVHRQVLDGHLTVLHDARMKRLHPVDLAHNARDRRGDRKDEPLPSVAPVKTAATLAFERDFAPVVTDDGSFTDKE